MCNIYDDNRHVTTKLSYRRFPKWIRNWKIIFQKDIRQFGSGNTGAIIALEMWVVLQDSW